MVDLGSNRLRSLCRGLGFDSSDERRALSIFRKLAASWGARSALKAPPWASDITDDHSPFEFSVAVDGAEPELRFLIEVLGDTPGLQSNWEASLAMNEQLAAEYGVHLGRLAEVQDLFAPTSECHRFTLWHAVCLRPGAAPDFKIYLNPQSRGRAQARNVVETAMRRLGFGDAVAHLPEIGPDDEITYFSLDLSAKREARVKVYTAHHHATVERIDQAIQSARGHAPGKTAEFCEAMSGSLGPYDSRPVLTCLSFVQGSATPLTGTVHFPVRTYAHDDRVVRDRIVRYLNQGGAPVYARAIEAFTDRELEDGLGMQTYASLRVDPERQRVTVYLAPEVYDVGQAAMTLPAASSVLTKAYARRTLRPAALEQTR
ncbi:MAG: tryptophan dimethylallyltransferase family protein [Minicystis sp.]